MFFFDVLLLSLMHIVSIQELPVDTDNGKPTKHSSTATHKSTSPSPTLLSPVPLPPELPVESPSPELEALEEDEEDGENIQNKKRKEQNGAAKLKKKEETKRALKAKQRQLKEVLQLQDEEDQAASQDVVFHRPEESGYTSEWKGIGQVRHYILNEAEAYRHCTGRKRV